MDRYATVDGALPPPIACPHIRNTRLPPLPAAPPCARDRVNVSQQKAVRLAVGGATPPPLPSYTPPSYIGAQSFWMLRLTARQPRGADVQAEGPSDGDVPDGAWLSSGWRALSSSQFNGSMLSHSCS